MSQPISVDEVASFPYAGVDECDLSSDGLRIAYTHQGQIYITDFGDISYLRIFQRQEPQMVPQPAGRARFSEGREFRDLVEVYRWN